MWRVVDLSKTECDPDQLESMCRYAVNLSQGELLDITIEDFGGDELILYIAKRASKLKRLRLVSCYYISNESLSTAAAQLPSLQDLQIYFTDLSIECIKTIGLSCPSLKSFTYNKCGYPHPSQCDKEALAVAETMQGLHHLSLFGNAVTNKGVQAILDGCPNLESLDLRRCFNVNFGDLGGRWKEIKVVKRPTDPTFDYEFWNYVDDYFEEDYGAFSDAYPFDYFDMGYDDDEFEYDDYTDPFRAEYFDDFYSDVPLEWFL